MKHLRIEYNGITLYNGEVNEVTWSDSDNGIKVEGRVRGGAAPSSAGGGLAGFFESIANASKNRTQEVVEEKRQQLREEKEAEAAITILPGDATQVIADAEVAVQ